MPQVIADYDFIVEDNPACWAGLLSHFELKLLRTLPIYALEQLRARFLHTVTTSSDSRQAARRVFQMAFETEIGVAIAKIVSILPDQRDALVCPARRYLEIDGDMAPFSFLYAPALDVIEQNGFLPLYYVNLFRAHIGSPYARYRMCGVAALLCATAQYLIPDQNEAFALIFADAAVAADAYVRTPGRVVTKADVLAVLDAVNVLAQVVYQDNPVAVDAVHMSRGLGRFDVVTVSDTVAVVYTQGAFWRAQTSPVALPLGTLLPHAGVYGVDDFEIYASMSDSAGTSYVWKWDGTAWSSCPTGSMARATRIWATHDGGKVYVLATSSFSVWRSTNHGASFLALPWPFIFMNDGFAGFEDHAGVVTLLVAQNGGGVVKTTNDGVAWSTVMPTNFFYGTQVVNVIWGTDPNNLYFGGVCSAGAFLAHWDGAALTDLTANVTPFLSEIHAIWGANTTDAYVGGSKGGGGPGCLLHTTDSFATFTEETLPSFSGGTLNNVYSVSGIDETHIFATVQNPTQGNYVIVHADGAQLPDVWASDGALTSPADDALCVWVNPTTGRAVLLSAHGHLQTNKNPAPGRSTSPRERAGDAATVSDAVVVQVNP